MLHRRLLAIGCAIGILLTAGGCAGSATPVEDVEFSAELNGTLHAWGFDGADDVGQARLDDAAAVLDDQGVTVDLDASAFDSQRFTTLLASGNLPDVVQMDRNFVATYAAQGFIVPLDECFSLYDIDPADTWYPQVAQDVTWNDHIWATPQFYQPPLILLNQRVMDEFGVTADDFSMSDPDRVIEIAGQMTDDSGGNLSQIGFDPQGVSKAALWLLSFGGQLVDENGAPTLDNEQNVAAVEFLRQLYDAQGGYAEVTSLVDSFDVFGDNNPYVADQVGAAVFDQWYLNVLTPYAEKVELGATPVTTADGDPFTVASGSSFVIPVGAENPSAACAWMIALTTPDAWASAAEARAATTAAEPDRNGINAGLFTGSPGPDSAIRDEYATGNGYAGFEQAIGAYYDVAAIGTSIGGSPAGQEIQSALQDAVTSALLGEASAADALGDAQSQAMHAYEQVMAGVESSG